MPVQPSSEWLLVGIGACAAFSEWFLVGIGACAAFLRVVLVGIGACTAFRRVVPGWHRFLCSLPQIGSCWA